MTIQIIEGKGGRQETSGDTFIVNQEQHLTVTESVQKQLGETETVLADGLDHTHVRKVKSEVCAHLACPNEATLDLYKFKIHNSEVFRKLIIIVSARGGGI